MVAFQTHRMIEKMIHDPALLEQLIQNREAVFDAFDIPETERQALRAGSIEALSEVGVHPILQIFYQLTLNPAMLEHMSLKDYQDDIAGVGAWVR
jgi:hypothetical protein